MSDSAKRPLRIFISYSHKDTRWIDELKLHLSPLVRKEFVDSWDDKRISLGGDWRGEIEKAMEDADCGVLLVTPNFLASPFIQGEELPKLLNKPRVLWIAVRDSNFKHTALGKLQCANDPGRPMAKLSSSLRDTEWVLICNKLLALAGRAKPEPASTHSPAVDREPRESDAVPPALIPSAAADPLPVVSAPTSLRQDYPSLALVNISAGEYPIGASDGHDDEKPPDKVSVDAFRIAVYPVTNAEYARFIEAGGYEDERWWDFAMARAWRAGAGRPESIRPKHWDDAAYNDASQPVVGVCWHEARAYCAWLSAKLGSRFRLPTEVEWEAAARGREGRKYPWGNDFDSTRCNTSEGGRGRPSPVGAYNDATPEGVRDLSGNVWEWTSSLYQLYPYRPNDGREDVGPDGRRVLRGGSWDVDSSVARAAFRGSCGPDERSGVVGFRVVSPALNR